MEQTPVQETPPAEPLVENTVAKDVYDRTKADMFKAKEENAALKKQLDDAKVTRLKETKNWEELAKQREEEARSEKDKRERLETALVHREKIMALRVEAQKAGMLPSAMPDLDLLDLPEVQVETTSSGKILVHGADRAITNLKALRAHWFGSKAPSINSASPEALPQNSTSVTQADLLKFEADYKKNPSESNKKAYFDAIMKFKNPKPF